MPEKIICKYCKKAIRKSKNITDLTDIKYHNKCKEHAKDDLKSLCFFINNFIEESNNI